VTRVRAGQAAAAGGPQAANRCQPLVFTVPAFGQVERDVAAAGPGGPGGHADQVAAQRGAAGMIGYTLPEIRRLLAGLIQRYSPDPGRVWSWSRWRRRRQYQAWLCHYRQRGYALT
jgi:hypothetical protein